MFRPNHFEVHASDPERAIRFYGDVFGWTFHKWEGEWEYWMISTGPDERVGINGGLMRRQGESPATGQPVNAFVITVGVDDLDATLAKAVEARATVALPKMTVPGIGWAAQIHDPEGNILGLMQEDPSAK